ncbi:hypothetical protein WMY93_000965 [Mugilogobius chulae]|uniref:Uncharacterized protein n=1 Tax=Mugilogobius chulae TaxID=88201 RepID=A0AAW0QBE6_9GOBI
MSSEWLKGIDYPQAYPALNPTPLKLYDANYLLSADELSVKVALEDLGVTREHTLNNSVDLRSPITGVYRILLHRVQKRSSVEAVGYSQCIRSPGPRESRVRQCAKQEALCGL